MCEIAKILGRCPMEIEGAARKKKPWCEDVSQQQECGNEANGNTSKEQINFRSKPVYSSQIIPGVSIRNKH